MTSTFIDEQLGNLDSFLPRTIRKQKYTFFNGTEALESQCVRHGRIIRSKF